MDNSSGVLVLILRAGQDWVGQIYIQLVVVLDQGDVFVVKHQVFEGRVQIVRLSESITCGCLVDDAVFGVTLHTGKTEITFGDARYYPNRKMSVYTLLIIYIYLNDFPRFPSTNLEIKWKITTWVKDFLGRFAPKQAQTKLTLQNRRKSPSVIGSLG